MKKAIKIACVLLASLMILLSVSCKRKENPAGGDTETAAPVGAYAYDTETLDMLTEKKIFGENLYYYTYKK